MSYVPSGTVYNSPSRYIPGMRDAGQDYVARSSSILRRI